MSEFVTDFPGRVSIWEGCKRYDFTLDGVACLIVEPLGEAAAGRPWYWRARFFGAFPFPDLALVRRGWHLAATDVADLYGAPEAVRRFDNFYRFMVSRGFSAWSVPVGYSRGGLIVYNWARRNPDKIACIYQDNAVCDFKSWPGGKGMGPGSPDDWQKCLNAYGLTEEEAMRYPDNPVDTLDTVARAGIPVLHVCALRDTLVPAEENTLVVERRMRELGGNFTAIYKPDDDHHPHSLSDPTPIVEFVERHFQAASAGKS